MYSSQIQKFLESKTPLPKMIVIFGPTGSGKSAMAVDIAQYIDHPCVISADSRQVYRGLDIGTGKITQEEMRGVPHCMLDVIEPSEKYSLWNFRKDADAIMESWNQESQSKKIVPILCGGTGLYLDALLYDMDLPENPPDWKYREELEQIRQEFGNEHIWQMLYEVDPDYARELHPSNYRYVIRGLEVMRDTGKSKKQSHNTKKLRFSPLFLTPYIDSRENREVLYKNIDTRVIGMFKNGLLEEVIYNVKKYGAYCPGLKTIGYMEVIEYINGKISLDTAQSLVQQHSRNYAKRQLTWNKRYGISKGEGFTGTTSE